MINKIEYTNERGQSLELNHSGPLFLFNPEGFDGLNSDVVSHKSMYQDGTSVDGVILNERLLTLNCYLSIDSEQERDYWKNKLYGTFSPKFKGSMIVHTETSSKIVKEAVVVQAPLFDMNYANKNELVPFQIQLIMPDPFFESLEIIEDIRTWTGGLPFKFSLPFRLKQKGDTVKNIYNTGHVDAPIKVYFHGPAINPSIINMTTGEFIKVNKEILEGETLIINTEFGNKTVEIDKGGTISNAFYYLDLDSSFFSLQVGDNLIGYTTDNELQTQNVEIKYRNKYLGV